MIIKCPECKNVFLAPDDLEEGQELKCGQCGHQWNLAGNNKSIPQNIKPSSSNHIEDFKSNEKSEPSFFKGASVFVVLAIIAIIAAVQFKQEIIQAWQPSEKIFSKVEKVDAPINNSVLVLQDLKAVEKGDLINLTGKITNTSAEDVKSPNVKIANKFYAKLNAEIVPANRSISINAQLPNGLKSPIEVSF